MRFKLVLLFGALAALGTTSLEAQTRVLTGRVVDALSGAEVSGADITVVGSTARVIAGQDGSFSFPVPVGPVELAVARIGFRDLTISVPAGQDNVVISLDADALRLDAVVVTGVVTSVSRRNAANAVASIQGDQVQQVTSQSIEHALQGKVLGAYIQTNSGAPGGGAQVRMRGITSINATASPLWIVDGIVASDAAIPSNQNVVTDASTGNNPSLFQDGQVNRIVDLNPEDIESIEVLKGASASAIYGSKASNGVIIVTTRRGTPGAPRLSVRQRFGFFDLSNKLGFNRFATAADYDAIGGPGAAAALGFQPGVTFDLEETLAGRNALSHETAFNVSGGFDDTRYFVSGLWQDDEGIMENTGFEKQSLRVNVDQLFGDRVSASVSTNLIHTNAQRGLTNNDNAGVSPYMVWAFTYNFVDRSSRRDGSIGTYSTGTLRV
jgi:TonB-dependent SusC/RagA subfamily outer membrane receptor